MSIKKLDDSCKELCDKDEVEEISTTAGAPGYETPYAFSDEDNDDLKKLGETKYKNIMGEIYNLNYNSYKKDESLNTKQKVNGAISEISKKLFQIERILGRNLKLKKEQGLESSSYWKSTKGKLGKISERMNRIAVKMRDLSA
jgi:hypothetical protein